ncbi:MAG: 2TM domain-containing protein [Candidatus Pacebacteria bacterium]|nr:2TM domain-containing protein [Candidatus Paceibacterota bacterium]
MFSLTKNLKIFAALFFFYTIIFRYFLSYSITNQMPILKWIVAIIYGIIIFFTAFMLGKSEVVNTGVIYLGFKYHLISYLIFNIFGIAWNVLELSSKYEDFSHALLIMGIWGIFLLIHLLLSLLLSKNAIKGIPQDDIFE